MRKKNYKGRCEKRTLSKCQDICRTYDPIQSAYADELQAVMNIIYATDGVERVISHIRKSYEND